MKLARPQTPPKNPLAEKFWGRSPSRRAKRKGVGGKEFLPACFRSRSVWEKEKRKGGLGGIPLFLCEIKLWTAPPPARILGGQNTAEKYSFHQKKKKSGARKMKRAKSIFLWCGELVEQWRGWLPYWGFCSKKVRTSIKKHRQFSLFVKS